MKALFLAWFYGVPLLLIAGLARHLDDTGNLRASDAVAATVLVVCGLSLAVGLPIAGVVIAALRRDRRWIVHYGIALAVGVAWAVIVALLLAAAGGAQTPQPSPPHCQSVSGGRGCPGG